MAVWFGLVLILGQVWGESCWVLGWTRVRAGWVSGVRLGLGGFGLGSDWVAGSSVFGSGLG